MGILDDAIREHLELKRAHGASEAELSAKETEAFGPQHQEVAPEAPVSPQAPVEEPEPADEPPVEEPPAEEDGAEDVLEETPEFLQDAPEHDRLWFEQKPPRDFDFGE